MTMKAETWVAIYAAIIGTSAFLLNLKAWFDSGDRWQHHRIVASRAVRPSAAQPRPIWRNPRGSVRRTLPACRPPARRRSAKRSVNVCDAIALLIAELSLSMIGRGTPAGAMTPLQVGAA